MRVPGLALVALASLWVSDGSEAQRPAAPDLTGYWVSVVSQDWHMRMTVPPKGDYSMLPLNAEAIRVGDSWDPAAAAGRECGAYGAAAVMRVPGHLHFHWADDATLQLDIDSGLQTRLFRFEPAPTAPMDLSLQGYSVAAWSDSRDAPAVGDGPGRLTVTTTGMQPGYLRRNGAPYSERATLEEHFEAFAEPNGDQWLVVTSILTDPVFLTRPYISTSHFRKLPNGDAWDPTPCRVDRPR